MDKDQLTFSFDEKLKMSSTVIEDVINCLKSEALPNDEMTILNNVLDFLSKSKKQLDLISTEGEPEQELLKFKTAFFYMNLLIDEIDKVIFTEFFKNPNRSINRVYRYKVIALEITKLNEAFLEYGGLIEFEIDLEN